MPIHIGMKYTQYNLYRNMNYTDIMYNTREECQTKTLNDTTDTRENK